jgi:hypothetical protein
MADRNDPAAILSISPLVAANGGLLLAVPLLRFAR